MGQVLETATGCGTDVTSEEANVTNPAPLDTGSGAWKVVTPTSNPTSDSYSDPSSPEHKPNMEHRRVKTAGRTLNRGKTEPKRRLHKRAFSHGDLFRCETQLCIHGLNVSFRQTESDFGEMVKRFESMRFDGADMNSLDDDLTSLDEWKASLALKEKQRARNALKIKTLELKEKFRRKNEAAEELTKPDEMPKRAESPEPSGFPLCSDPYSREIQELVDKLTEEAKKDTSLAYNNFKDPCPKQPSDEVELNAGHDYSDKTKKLPGGPLLWPAGFPHPVYKPKKNYMTGHYVQVAGTKAEKKPTMFLRITQDGNYVTFDASVDKFKRAKRTWKSGHYMYEPLVNGDNLFGAWCVAGDKALVGFFYAMEKGLCFRIERRLVKAGKYTFLRQSNEFMGRVMNTFFVRVDEDSGSTPAPVVSRDYTCLCGKDNVPTNTGVPYPCQGVDLDPLKEQKYLRGAGDDEVKEDGRASDKPAYVGFQFAEQDRKFGNHEVAPAREEQKQGRWGLKKSWPSAAGGTVL